MNGQMESNVAPSHKDIVSPTKFEKRRSALGRSFKFGSKLNFSQILGVQAATDKSENSSSNAILNDISATGYDSFSNLSYVVEEVRPGLRSCLKGSFHDSNEHIRELKKKRKVRFSASRSKVYLVPTLFQFESDIWYSKKEELWFLRWVFPTRKEAKLAEKYMKAYVKAREAVFATTWSKGVEIKESEHTELPPDCRKQLVVGHENGLAGYEQFENDSKSDRMDNIKEYVTLVVATYKRCIANNATAKETRKRVQKCCKVLSAADAYWALEMGRICREAGGA